MKKIARALAVLVSVIFLSLFAAVDVRGAQEPQATPNIVLIMADDVGVETLGCYGGRSYPTPRLDALARGGMRFNHCYSMPSCHPTRICLMTGRYPFRLKNPRWGSFPKTAERQTFAHVLKKAGYATAVAGKWRSGWPCPPWERASRRSWGAATRRASGPPVRRPWRQWRRLTSA